MRPEDLTSLLAAAATGGRDGTAACPDEQWIAAYVDGTLEPAALEPLERHLADCDACLALVGFLGRERETSAMASVAESTVARARSLVTQAPGRRWRRAPQWAAAAALVVSAPLLIQLARAPDSDVERRGTPAERSTRTIGPSGPALRLLYPGADVTVDVRQLDFRWTEVPGSPYYDVRIVTDSGDLVIQERVEGTQWRPQGQLALRPGAGYFVRIDAYPSGDKALSSDHVPFRVSD